MPAYAVIQNYHQGLLVHGKRTHAITEAVIIYLLVCSPLLALAAEFVCDWPGVTVAMAAFNVAGLCQTGWLVWRSRALLQPRAAA